MVVGDFDTQWESAERAEVEGRFDEMLATFKGLAAYGLPEAQYAVGVAYDRLSCPKMAESWFRKAARSGSVDAIVQLACFAHDRGRIDDAIRQLRSVAGESPLGAAILGSWLWETTREIGLEDELRRGMVLYASARCALAELLVATGRVTEARVVLEGGCDLEQVESFVPLGNLLLDHYKDEVGAREVWRKGLALGDAHAGQNLAWLVDGTRRC